MWKKINESKRNEIYEDQVLMELDSVYHNLENIRDRLNKSTNIELREKYMRPIVDFMNWLDYEI